MTGSAVKYYHFKALLQQQGWMSPAYVGVAADGTIHYLSNRPPGVAVGMESVLGYALPGFQNAHSHAFQYAMAGMVEKHPPGSTDDFWTWREAMYRCALSIEPDEMEAIAAMAYAEMLRKGYTSVAEFHYLHHDRNGNRYANRAEMAERLVAAAKTAGIKITLVPVFYQCGGFGQKFQPRQVRFISDDLDDYLRLLADTYTVVSSETSARLGFGVHSLRAVHELDLIKTVEDGPKDIPFHIHAAEQLKEVKDCLAHLDRRPVEWLLENLPLNDRFHIVHGTHMNDHEIQQLAKTTAHVVLCPGTEGNLGDGIFRLRDYALHYGNLSIGTDSHISLNPLEDLRWLDYGQRLTSHMRSTFDDGATLLLNKTIVSGRKAMGVAMDNFFEIGKAFDAVIFTSKSPLLSLASTEHLLQTIVYTADSSSVLGTIVNGNWVVKNLHHFRESPIQRAFSRAIKNIRK